MKLLFGSKAQGFLFLLVVAGLLAFTLNFYQVICLKQETAANANADNKCATTTAVAEPQLGLLPFGHGQRTLQYESDLVMHNLKQFYQHSPIQKYIYFMSILLEEMPCICVPSKTAHKKHLLRKIYIDIRTEKLRFSV